MFAIRSMIPTIRTLIVLSVMALGLFTTAVAADGFNWDVWRTLPVLQGGRHKPLDTLAIESLRGWANRSHVVDPQSGERLDPTALYVTLLLEWNGWEHADRGQLELASDWRSLYFPLHAADRWDRLPLLRIEDATLRAALLVKLADNRIAPEQLVNARIQDYRRNREVPFPVWAESVLVRDSAGEELADIERHGLELARRLWSYQNHRMARGLALLPELGVDDGHWTPLSTLLLTKYDENSDPTGDRRTLQASYAAARHAWTERDVASFNQESERFVATARRLGSRTGVYPSERMIGLEAAYNQWAPFRIAWALMLAATISCLLRAGLGVQSLGRVAVVAYVGALAAMLAGFTARGLISGRPPVTNMYESVVYVGAGVALLGLVFAVRHRQSFPLAAAATVSTLALILADCAPLVLDPGVRPLEPVLRSNFWLVTHVLTITLSYAALALALGLANITLGYCLVRADDHGTIATLSRLTYKLLQFGVLLLAAGVVLGGVWADYSWGRFWGWDPKEVWALVALLGYLAVLHARFVGWVGDRGLAALTVCCFTLVVMGWYGVNFVLGAGLHSYGFGGGGQRVVYAAVVLQLLYVAAAVLRAPESE